jgi:hypothetical protein
MAFKLENINLEGIEGNENQNIISEYNFGKDKKLIGDRTFCGVHNCRGDEEEYGDCPKFDGEECSGECGVTSTNEIRNGVCTCYPVSNDPLCMDRDCSNY